MPTNNFKLFDQNKANLLSDTEYANATQRLNGVQTGVASSQLNNKFAYQVSLVAYAIAQIMNQNGLDASDTLSVSAFVGNLGGSLLQKVVDKASTVEAQAGISNTKWMTPALVKAAIDMLETKVGDIVYAASDSIDDRFLKLDGSRYSKTALPNVYNMLGEVSNFCSIKNGASIANTSYSKVFYLAGYYFYIDRKTVESDTATIISYCTKDFVNWTTHTILSNAPTYYGTIEEVTVVNGYLCITAWADKSHGTLNLFYTQDPTVKMSKRNITVTADVSNNATFSYVDNYFAVVVCDRDYKAVLYYFKNITDTATKVNIGTAGRYTSHIVKIESGLYFACYEGYQRLFHAGTLAGTWSYSDIGYKIVDLAPCGKFAIASTGASGVYKIIKSLNNTIPFEFYDNSSSPSYNNVAGNGNVALAQSMSGVTIFNGEKFNFIPFGTGYGSATNAPSGIFVNDEVAIVTFRSYFLVFEIGTVLPDLRNGNINGFLRIK